MNTHVADRLRSLAQDHHDGKLDLAAYRALRAPLLDSLSPARQLAAGTDITQPRGAPRQPDRDAITRPGRPRGPTEPGLSAGASSPDRRSPLPISQAPSSNERRPARLLIALAVLGAIVVAIASWMLLHRNPSGEQAGQPTVASPAGGASPGPAAGAPVNGGGGSVKGAQSVVERFLTAGDWSDARAATLNRDLTDLGPAQIAAVAREGWFQQFVDEVRRRLKEEQALSPTRLTAQNSPLAALAVTVGLDLNSPDSAIQSPPPPAPPPLESEAAQSSGAPPAHPSQQAHVPASPAGGTGDVARSSQPAGAPPVSGATGTNPAADHARSGLMTGTEQTPSVGTSTQPVRKSVGATGSEPFTHPAVAANPSPGAAASPGPGSAPGARSDDAHPDSLSSPDACRAELARSRRPLCHDQMTGGGEGPEMAVVPAGTFDMGSTAASEEQPVHHVTISQPFAVSVYEVSQGEFKQFCDATHRACAAQPWTGDDYPVVNVSWDEARAYADWLTSVTHHHYALPTEAQWEYAARAGSTGLYPNGDTTLSPTDAYYSVAKEQTVAARRSQRFNANAFRLEHTIGNVREWVDDVWVQNFTGAPDDGTAVRSSGAAMRVVRGGSYADSAARLRLSLREGLAPSTRDVTTGFRIVRALP